MLSASVSILILSANPSSVGSVLTILRAWTEPDKEPVIFSPIENVPEIEDTSKIFETESHVLTLPVAPLIAPVTVSLNL